jgi:hypothetical protein
MGMQASSTKPILPAELVLTSTYWKTIDLFPWFNGTIISIAQIIKFVMALATKSELAALFITAQEMIPHCQTLIAMGWPHPKSPIQADNSTAAGGYQQNNRPLQVQDDGYAILVAPLPCIPRSILLLLGGRCQELSQLPNQTPP